MTIHPSCDVDDTTEAPEAAAPPWTPRAVAHWRPKAGNSADEYEDAWAIGASGDDAPGVFACAVADGATETSFSGRWAQLLCAAYCAGARDPEGLFAALPDAQGRWRDEVAALPLPWYAEEKARRGAFAALVGLTCRPADPAGATGAWAALACGDSCVFQVRDDELLAACPLARSSAFTNSPALLSSDAASNARLVGTLAYVGGDWCAGDRFYLLTDALACWFLAAFEDGACPWHQLDPLAAPDAAPDFAAFIADLRAARALRNDDVTMIRVFV